MNLSPNIRCPACSGPLRPSELHCDPCDLTLRGHFVPNEFAALAEEDLHFLRIFVLCDGRIRDMESALGVSYPTIKSRLAHLKETLARQAASRSPEIATAPASPTEVPPTSTALNDLAAGRATFDQTIGRIRRTEKENGT